MAVRTGGATGTSSGVTSGGSEGIVGNMVMPDLTTMLHIGSQFVVAAGLFMWSSRQISAITTREAQRETAVNNKILQLEEQLKIHQDVIVELRNIIIGGARPPPPRGDTRVSANGRNPRDESRDATSDTSNSDRKRHNLTDPSHMGSPPRPEYESNVIEIVDGEDSRVPPRHHNGSYSHQVEPNNVIEILDSGQDELDPNALDDLLKDELSELTSIPEHGGVDPTKISVKSGSKKNNGVKKGGGPVRKKNIRQ